jgi:hypothetical protein
MTGGMSETVEDFDDVVKLGQGFSTIYELEEVDLGTGGISRLTYINACLTSNEKDNLHEVLREYAGCFAWSYTEMTGLGRDRVKHTLPIRPWFRPFKEPARNFNIELLGKIKEGVEQLLQANFIWTSRYADWVSNIVLVENKNTGKLRVCVDFRNMNMATPKDEYPMLVAEALINRVSGHRMSSFFDGNVGYYLIFMAEQDVPKTAFHCPGFGGLFE